MFGRGSQLSGMIIAFRKVNKRVPLYAMRLATSGTAATKTITVTGDATSDGALHFIVGGVRVDVAVTDGDTDDEIAAAIDAALATIEADTPYSYAVSTNVVTGTARHTAAFTQDYRIMLNYGERESLDMPAGVSIVIADGVSGATDPDVQDAIDALGSQGFQHIILGFNGDANLDAAEAYSSDQWGPTVQVDTHFYTGFSGTASEFETYLSNRNSKFVTIPFIGENMRPWWEDVAATVATALLEDDPARPRQTMEVPYMLAPPKSELLTFEDRGATLEAGGSTYTVTEDGKVQIERLVTNYVTDANGINDSTFRNWTTMQTLAALRYTFRARISQKYPRHKLASDGTDYGPGQAVVTPSVLVGEALAIAKEWERRAWIEDFDGFKDALIMERNTDDPDRVDAVLGPNLVNQFRVMAVQIQFGV